MLGNRFLKLKYLRADSLLFLQSIMSNDEFFFFLNESFLQNLAGGQFGKPVLFDILTHKYACLAHL